MKFLVRSALCAIIPPSDTLPGLIDMDVDGYIERLRQDTALLYWVGIILSALLFTLLPVITVWIPLPTFLLPERLRDRHVSKMMAHPLYPVRQAAYMLRLTAGVCWGADERVRAHFQMAPCPKDPGTWRTA